MFLLHLVSHAECIIAIFAIILCVVIQVIAGQTWQNVTKNRPQMSGLLFSIIKGPIRWQILKIQQVAMLR